MIKKILITSFLAISLLFLCCWKLSTAIKSGDLPLTSLQIQPDSDSSVTVIATWELPAILKEISGIAWLGENRLACVQDEEGKIFIYNTAGRKIEKLIPVASGGDFEGIAVVNNNAYLLRSDGTLFEALNYNSAQPTVKEYSSIFHRNQNFEGLCYDAKHNRLLLLIKDHDPSGNGFNGMYAFDLLSKTMIAKQVYQINQEDVAQGDKKKKKKSRPSDLAIHPQTGEIYVVDGQRRKLMVLGSGGSIAMEYTLNSRDFPQPEGIAITEKGRLFISTEGKKGPGTILEIDLGSN